jgi:hypothetical protein|tara:strand:- start:635 stop:1207 length:573 start_codon:yes stop_codon:yes gene_type:complete
MAWNNDDYIEVKDRIIKFYQDYPNGRVVTSVIEMTDTRVTVKAYVYQDGSDTCPTTGHSWLTIPGTTNFTRGSELENAETSAVGRALALSGYEVKKSIASRDEVAMKQNDGPPSTQPLTPSVPYPVAAPSERKATDKQLSLISSKLASSTATTDDLLAFIFDHFAITSSEQLLMDHVSPLLDWISSHPTK